MPDVLARVRFLPKLPHERFLDLLSIADVMLDPIVFGGGNTSYEGLGLGTPIITWPDPFLRSRLTAAMYRQMVMEDLVVDSAESYVALAVELACEPDRREACRQKILVTNHAIFRDAAAIEALEDVLLRLLGGITPTRLLARSFATYHAIIRDTAVISRLKEALLRY